MDNGSRHTMPVPEALLPRPAFRYKAPVSATADNLWDLRLVVGVGIHLCWFTFLFFCDSFGVQIFFFFFKKRDHVSFYEIVCRIVWRNSECGRMACFGVGLRPNFEVKIYKKEYVGVGMMRGKPHPNQRCGNPKTYYAGNQTQWFTLLYTAGWLMQATVAEPGFLDRGAAKFN